MLRTSFGTSFGTTESQAETGESQPEQPPPQGKNIDYKYLLFALTQFSASALPE
jgi:hypothetical protein